ncbi:ribosome-recycling factor, mitochondrial [Plakobranchus ocellatus]|uniref:Ribosome-recycling factor, mitochondrial n=1 Tax=Plakobranchus ocellatus TaxID=259542 RepID=A0AAV3ZFR9_9GAST|nr:ribosome-recycling factor, mitochondrial [Plakobranchus ocellatus]
MGFHRNFFVPVLRRSITLKIVHLNGGLLPSFPTQALNHLKFCSSSTAKSVSVGLISRQAQWQKTSCFSAKPQLLQPPHNLSWSIWRAYAKKGKDKGGKAHKKVTLTEDQLDGVVDMERVKREFDQVVEDLKEKFIHQLTVRTSQGVFDNLTVKTPDGNFPLIQLGQVIQKSPQLLTINMAFSPQYIPQVKQALTDSGLNINPQQDGTSLFIPLPKVTREHRENLAKNAKMLSEQSKKSMREIYSKHAKKIKASKQGHSSDDLIAADDMVKDLMHSLIHQVEEMTTLKQKELLGGK